MDNEEIIITKVRKGRAKKQSSQLEKVSQEESRGNQDQVLEAIGADGIRPIPSPIIPPGIVPSLQANIVHLVSPSVEKKPRKKSVKTLAKEELIEAEKQLKKAQLEQEQEMRKKALEEIQKLESLKAQLLREEIQKQIESEAKGEVKRTRKSQKVSSAEGEKKKTTRKLVKDLMPSSSPIPEVSRINSSAPIRSVIPPTVVSQPSSRSNPFSQRGGRSYF